MQDTCSTLAFESLEAAGDYKQALDAYLAAFRTGAAGVEIEALLFREDFLLKTYPHSIIALSTLAGRPESAPVWRLLARVCETKGDYELALTLASKAQQENPHDVASLSILARISERQQKMAEAAEWHRHLLAVAPPNVRVSYRFLAQFYYDQAEYQAAPCIGSTCAGSPANQHQLSSGPHPYLWDPRRKAASS
jgi:tetratricopeptide (TPR) repeat protein